MKPLALIGFLLAGLGATAQGFLDLAKVEYQYGLNNANYDDYQALRFSAQYPIVLKNEDVVLTGLAVGGYGLSLDDVTFEPRNIRFNVGYRWKINEQKSLTLITIHRMNGDSYQPNIDNFQFGVIGLYTYRDKPGPMLQFGFYTNTEFVGQFFTPLFGLDWNISPRVRFFGVLPINGTMQVTGTDRFLYGVNFTGVFATYRLEDLGNHYLQENINQLSLYTDLYLTKQLVFNVKLGYRLGSNNRLYRNGDKIDLALNMVKIGDDRTQIDNIKTDGLVISAGLVFRYKIPESE